MDAAWLWMKLCVPPPGFVRVAVTGGACASAEPWAYLPHPPVLHRLLVLIVLARLGFNAALGRAAQRLARARGVDEHHRDGRRLLEECWVLLGNAAMLAASQYVVLHRWG